MWCTRRNDYHVARLDTATHTTLNFRSTDPRAVYLGDDLVGALTSLWINQCAPRHQSSGALDHVVNLRYLVVQSAESLRRRCKPVDRADPDIVSSRVHHANRRVVDGLSACDLLFQSGLNIFRGHISGRDRL